LICSCTPQPRTPHVRTTKNICSKRKCWTRTVLPMLTQYEEPSGGEGEINAGATLATHDPLLPPAQPVHVTSEAHTVSAFEQSMRQRLSRLG
jgi:hypothetical protein